MRRCEFLSRPSSRFSRFPYGCVKKAAHPALARRRQIFTPARFSSTTFHDSRHPLSVTFALNRASSDRGEQADGEPRRFEIPSEQVVRDAWKIFPSRGYGAFRERKKGGGGNARKKERKPGFEKDKTSNKRTE